MIGQLRNMGTLGQNEDGATWPEQEAIYAWLKKHYREITMDSKQFRAELARREKYWAGWNGRVANRLALREGELADMKKQLDAVREMLLEAKPVFATASNTKYVREGLKPSGYIKHYEVPTHTVTKVKNLLQGEK